MEPQGEFVAPAEPVATPARPTELPKQAKKGGKLAKILCVLFALIACGLGGYICYDKFVAKNDLTKTDVVDCEDSVDGVKEGETEDVADVKPKLEGFVDYAEQGDFASYYVTSTGEVYLVTRAIPVGGGVPDKEWAITNAEEIGEAGKYTLKLKELGNYSPYMYEESTMEIDGYKLDLKDIVYEEEAGFGQNKSELTTVFVDSDGNMSILTTKGSYSGSATAKLEKNVLQNVAGIKVVDGGEAARTMVFFRDGSQQFLNEKLLGASSD